jgi:SAM-dependent methyltransferase
VKAEDPDYRHIEETYDEGSQDYGDYFKNPHEFIERDRQQFIARLPAGSTILDCGCGPGMDTERFSQLGYKVTAIDLSDRFVELVRKRVPIARVEKMDMRNLAFPKEAFDGLWASFSLLHIRASEIQETLSETAGSFSLPCTGDRKPGGLRRRYREWSAIPTFKSGYKPTLKQLCAELASRLLEAARSRGPGGATHCLASLGVSPTGNS